MSVKHVHRFAQEFASRHNYRHPNAIQQMAALAHGMCGKRLTYKALVGRSKADEANTRLIRLVRQILDTSYLRGTRV
ncbi:MAG: hypothetical protein OXN89_18885 [Bryobacterales bacterium]|nr:hypothetical protein [Bryobacterales bacterium]